MIKVIKRNATPEIPRSVDEDHPPTQTVTATVNEWIDEQRQIRLDELNSSRNTIAGWAANGQ